MTNQSFKLYNLVVGSLSVFLLEGHLKIYYSLFAMFFARLLFVLLTP